MSDNGKLVLLAEDDELLRLVARKQLEHLSFHCRCAENGVQAVELANLETYAAILMDIQMPVMDGLEAAGKIREVEKNADRARTPIIAMTAFAENKFKNDDRIDDVLIKPVSLHSLRFALEKWRF